MERYKNEIMIGEECNAEYRKQKITELVEKIENPEFLEFLYQMLLSFKEKWGI